MISIDCKEYLSESAGGQILRVALSLSSIFKIPFSMKNIRIGRKDPGLKAQHLMSLRAVKKIVNAEVKGDKLGSLEVEFYPSGIKGGNFEFDIGTAGSITLFLQPIIPILISADRPSEIRVKGGTHVKWSPTIDYYENVFFKILKKFGVDVKVEVEKFGFYPRGGGSVKIFIEPSKLKSVEILERGKLKGIFGKCVLSRLREDILEREEAGVKEIFKEIKVEKVHKDSISGGTAVTVWADYENTVIGYDSIGERGKRAEDLGREAAKGLEEEVLKSGCVDKFMSDQILIYMALARNSRILVSEITEHAKSCFKIIPYFTGKEFSIEKRGNAFEVGI
jgi:RNA 3'-terminal phosphate cyclase (ATP)